VKWLTSASTWTRSSSGYWSVWWLERSPAGGAGHGLGLLGDLVAGVLGAFIGGILAQVFKINFAISGHPIITAMVVAFVGAVILLFLLRMLGFGRGRGEH